jgi:dihydrolipoamide dehydrogenase
MTEAAYDLVVIGSGPGGYVCAIRAAQLGMKVACVEKRETLGGTCLNVGCIPSKALLQASLDLKGMMAHKDKTVKSNVDGVAFLFKKNKIDWIKGTGRIAGAGKVEVALNAGGTQELAAKAIVIATGSDVVSLPSLKIDEKKIVSSTGALTLSEVPKSMVLVGGGVIGLEMGSVWQRLGAKVTVVEYLDRIMPGMDADTAKQMQRILTKQGMSFKLATKVTGAKIGPKGVALTVEPAAGGPAETIETDIVLVAIGRRPYTDGLGLKESGVNLDEKGRVAVDAHFQSNVPGIYAIGDCIAGPMLAHKAEDEGMAVAEILAGQHGHVNYDAIPSVVYTWPEVASVGKTEEQLKAEGVEYRTGKFPFTANGRARAQNNTDGFVKILADKATDRVLGVHMIGPSVGELTGEMALAIEFGASSEDIARTCHAHPTLTEAVREAALAVDGRPIHI